MIKQVEDYVAPDNLANQMFDTALVFVVGLLAISGGNRYHSEVLLSIGQMLSGIAGVCFATVGISNRLVSQRRTQIDAVQLFDQDGPDN